MPNTTRITKRIVDGLKPGELIWDSDVKGFGVRHRAHVKVYLLKVRINGRQRWLTIGAHGTPWTPETARHEAQRLWGNIREGVNLTAIREARRNQPTIAELCDRFIKDHALDHKKASSVAADERNIRNHIKPLLGSRTVAEVTRTDIDALKRKVRDGQTARRAIKKREGGRGGGLPVTGGPGAANRCIALLSKMFNLAEQWGWRTEQTNPCRMVQRYAEHPNQRFLSTKEIDRLSRVLDSLESDEPQLKPAIAAIRLLLLTGARCSEIIGLQWPHVDLERGMLLLPDSKTGQKTIYLNKAASAVLSSIKPTDHNHYVIIGSKPGQPFGRIQNTWQRIRKLAGIEDVRLHDLRHSFASIAAANGASLPLIGKLLGHSTPITTQRYAHLVADPVRDLTEAVGQVISSVGSSNRTA